MAQQIINIGSGVSAGNAEETRSGFDKSNQNFTELYTDKADLASPAFTGTPTAPTAAGGTNTTQLATTAFVLNNSGGGAFTFSETHTGVADPQIDIPIPAGAISVVLICNIEHSSDGSELRARVSNDNFATVETGASDYSYNEARAFPSSETNNGANLADHIRAASVIGSQPAEQFQGQFTINFPLDAGKSTGIITHHDRRNASANYNTGYGSGRYLIEEAITGIRLYPSAGTLTYTVHVFVMKAAGPAGNLLPPALTDFPTWVNQGNAIAEDGIEGMCIAVPLSVTAIDIRARVKTLPTAPKTYTTKIAWVADDANHQGAGIVIRDSATDRIIMFGLDYSQGLRSERVIINRFDDVDTFDSVVFTKGVASTQFIWLRLIDDGVDFFYEIS